MLSQVCQAGNTEIFLEMQNCENCEGHSSVASN